MLTDEELLAKIKSLIEARLSWGDSADWTNQDFIALSTRFQKEMDLSVSHVTLKRIWGKLSYNSLPQIYTLNALAKFAGYESWRNFKVNTEANIHNPESSFAYPQDGGKKRASLVIKNRLNYFLVVGFASIAFVVGLTLFFSRKKVDVNFLDYSLSVHKVLRAGLPNSVIFDYNADKSLMDG